MAETLDKTGGPAEPELFLKKDFASIVRDLLEDLGSGRGGRVALTDTTEGSVVRTLVEAFSRELAVTYAQLDQVYRLGYLDTAHGAALDNVVALLGLTRRRGGYLQGMVTFSRATAAPEDIPIPQGTRVTGKEALPVETTELAILPRGGTQVTVPVRSVEPLPSGLEPEELAALTAPGVLTLLPRPMLGVETATNAVALVPQSSDETDAELRERARRHVDSANLGTPLALKLALRSLGLQRVDVQEPHGQPGTVQVVVGDEGFEGELRERALRAIEETRPAGIHVRLSGVTWVWVQVAASLELDKDYSEVERRAIEAELRARLSQYLQGLGVGENVRDAKVRNLLASHDKVLDVHAVSGPSSGPLLRAFLRTGPGALEEQTQARLLGNQDVQVGPLERAGVDVQGRNPEPFDLRLEPPQPRVLVDVELQLPGGPVQDVGNRLGIALDHVTTQVHEANGVLTYELLAEEIEAELGRTPTSLRLLLVHERDGRAAELARPGDQDVLVPRERLVLRGLLGMEAGA